MSQFIQDPVTGDAVYVPAAPVSTVPAPASAPNARGWKRRDKAREFSFEYEGATIHCRKPDDEQWNELRADHAALQRDSTSLLRLLPTLQGFQNLGAGEALSITKEQVEGIETLIEKSDSQPEAQLKIAYKTVALFVIGWDNGPFPFAPQSWGSDVFDLDEEVVTEWARVIGERSAIGRKDADFLARRSFA